jgi:hypothetical protein
LLTLYTCEAFKKHTFWSEHLLLHTRQSLHAFLEAAGFTDIIVTGFQRYSLANHLYWLSQSKPGGHVQWSFLENNALHEAYAASLQKLDATDTLIAVAKK